MALALRRVVLVAAGLIVVGYSSFFFSRPLLETRLRARLQRTARERGFLLTVGALRLTPWLTLELRDVTLASAARVLVVTSAVDARPSLWPWSLFGPAAEVSIAPLTIRLPRGVELDVLPSRWAVSRLLRGWRLRRLAPGEELSASLTRSGGGRRLELRARNARFGRLLVNGCAVAEPGTAEGEGRLEEDPAGAVRVKLRGRTRGASFVSLATLEQPSCAGARAGAATDAELEAEALVDARAGSLRVDSFRLAAAGAEASGRLAVSGGRADPRIDLALEVPRLDFARLLATAGLEPAAKDLGSAALAVRVSGRLLDPPALVVTQRLEFTPPPRFPAAIERLRGPFVHRAEAADGRIVEILVSAESPDFVALTEVPPLLVRTLLLGEDANFFGHRGIDLAELPVALATNFARDALARGGSTIPQQLAKNLFLSRRKTIARKLEEASLALLLDRALGKERELEIYLNVIEWGPSVYGLRPASRYYFAREPMQLTPKQMAFLVSLIPGPLKYQRSFAGGSPTPFFEGLMLTLLDKLEATGALTAEEHAAALAAPLGLSELAPPLVDAVGMSH